jgi:hypothetical protein
MKKANPPHHQSLATRHSGPAAIQHPKFFTSHPLPVTRRKHSQSQSMSAFYSQLSLLLAALLLCSCASTAPRPVAQRTTSFEKQTLVGEATAPVSDKERDGQF